MSTKEEQKKDDAAKATDGAEAKASGAEAIEEDDAFEEFEPSAWGAHDEDAEDVQQWQVRLNHMPVYVFCCAGLFLFGCLLVQFLGS